ncbi:hypothetical protein GE09DRAFT_1228639 [Coniochaeta sp. 2T2.1]|nr:hypothetical protein GE09DRAFT_1228639 [Coniochaeta sp. 2T2.1]
MDGEDGRYPANEVGELDDPMGNNLYAPGDMFPDPTADDGPDDGPNDRPDDRPVDGAHDAPDDHPELEMLAYILAIPISMGISSGTFTAPELYEALLWMRTDEAPQTLKDNDMLRGVLRGNEAMLDAAVLKVIMVYQKQYPEAQQPKEVADMALVHGSLDDDIGLLTFGLGVVLCVFAVAIVVECLLLQD